MNHYSVTMNLLTKSKDSISTNIALDRIKLFVATAMESTVFVNQDNQEQAEFMQMIGINVTTLPEEPVDQIVGLMLHCKLNAVMEDRMIVERLDIASSLGDDVFYLHEHGDAVGPFQAAGWWSVSDTTHNSLTPIETHENVVHVPVTGWSKYNLNWPDSAGPESGKTVSFGKLNKNAN
jgi:hypothetical protein